MNAYTRKILILSILLLGLIYPTQNFTLKSFNTDNSCTDMSINNLKGIIGVMVQFEQEIPDDLRTSGDGQFIIINPEDSNQIYPSFINYDDLLRCSKTLLDSPPHDAEYFESQLKAVVNYYKSISDNQIFCKGVLLVFL